LLLVPAVIIVGLGGLCSVVFGMRVMCGCLAVMAGGVLVVFSSLDMVLYGLLGHVYSLS